MQPTIESPGLNQAIEDMEQVESESRIFLNNTDNPVAYKKLNQAIDQAYEDLLDSNPSTEYEKLVSSDIAYNLEANKKIADFITQNSSITVPEITDLVLGPGTYQKAKEEVLNFNFEEDYKLNKLRAERDNKLDTLEYRSRIENEFESLKENMQDYWIENKLVPEDFEFEVKLKDPVRNQRATWQGILDRGYIGLDYFTITKEGEKTVIDSTNVIHSLFHEISGHGLHQKKSKTLEYPQFSTNVYLRFPALAHEEGLAKKKDEQVPEFIESNFKDLPVTRQGLEINKQGRKNISQNSMKGYLRLLNERETRLEIRSATKVLSEKYDKNVAQSKLNTGLSLASAFKELSYIGGELLMDKIDYKERDPEAVATGAWSPQVLPHAVDFFKKA